MAVAATSSASGTTTASRRLSIGANVTIAIVAAALLLVLVNWFASIKNVRRDIASFGNYGLSERTKSVLQTCKEPIEVSMVYMPDEEDEKQQTYISRLQDYFDEMTRFDKKVQVSVVATDSQREKLVSRISTTFGSEADKHKAALAAYEALNSELRNELQQKLVAAQALMSGESWLGAFPIFASIVNTIRGDIEALKTADEAVKELTPAGGIPKYGEATTKAKEALADVKDHMQLIERRLSDLSSLADETTKGDSKYIAMLREVAAETKSLIASLRTTVGAEDAAMPADPAASLKLFADRGVEVGKGLDALVRRVDEFARKFPMVTQHPNWAASAQMGPLVTRMEVADVLHQAGSTLSKARLVILGLIDSGDATQLQNALNDARNNCTVLEKNAQVCEELLTGLAAGLSTMDDASRAMLDAARSKSLFAARVESIDALTKQIDELPELKLGSVADQLKQPNIVVIETAGKIRVVDFNEVWPVRESIADPTAKSADAARTFNGDSALSSAILAMTREGPFASVVLTFFEPPPPQQRNQFMPPPPQSWVPSSQLSELRKRLEAANFKVVDWNIAQQKDPPPPEQGVPSVYVCLPPPPPQPPNPFGQAQPPDQVFGDSHRKIIKDLLDADSRVLFLATWEVRSSGFFGGPPTSPPYGYGPLLDTDWGLTVDNGKRITWVDPDTTRDNSFFIVPQRFVHMPGYGFTDNPIGAPLKGTRFLITDACPIVVKPSLPAGVQVEPVLRIPDSQNYVGASMAELVEIIEKVQDPSSRGSITMVPPPAHGPFDVMVTAERSADGKSKGKIALVSFGASVRDDYLRQPVMGEGQQLRLEPPPTENVDLFVNALYWLTGQTQLISRGPVPVPRIEPIASADLKALRVFVWAVWPALVFAPGLILWYVRRR
ncbi:MAG: hypothetical protein DCC65_01055 [Planctomycetota bacterium]|nr:MAG: hypothetical protein DCC65_01055 [Planctomycetota bacterium]